MHVLRTEWLPDEHVPATTSHPHTVHNWNDAGFAESHKYAKALQVKRLTDTCSGITPSDARKSSALEQPTRLGLCRVDELCKKGHAVKPNGEDENRTTNTKPVHYRPLRTSKRSCKQPTWPQTRPAYGWIPVRSEHRAAFCTCTIPTRAGDQEDGT